MKKPTNIMTADAYQRLLAKQDAQAKARTKRHEESAVQRTCVSWFRAQYPAHALLLFAVPNGGGRSRVEAAILNGEGVTAGVADLILLEPRGGYGSLCIEMKTRAKYSRQEASQKAWQKAAESHGNLYAVCRDFDTFKATVLSYMHLPLNDGRVYVTREELVHGDVIKPSAL